MVKRRIMSFAHAGRGVITVVRTQPNARIHLAATLIVAALGIILRIGPGEWLAVALACGIVWAAECLNTAVELLADHVAPERHPAVGAAKDAAAAGVLVAAAAAAATGLVVFLPKLL
jgi:diacylglycerol kinase